MLLRTLKLLTILLLLNPVCRGTPVTTFTFTEDATSYELNIFIGATSEFNSFEVEIDNAFLFSASDQGSGLGSFSFTFGSTKANPSPPWYFEWGYHDITVEFFKTADLTGTGVLVDIGTYLIGPAPGQVPDSGTTLGLLGVGAAALVAFRRRIPA